MSLAFLDCHVKDDPARCAYLPSREKAQQYLGTDQSLGTPWKGFKPLWGSGLRFYRSPQKTPEKEQ